MSDTLGANPSQPLPPIVPGDDYPIEVDFFTEDVNGVLTPEQQPAGTTLRVMVKGDPEDADVDAKSDFTVNVSTNATSVQFLLPHTDTKDYPQGSQVWCQVRRILGSVYTTMLIARIDTAESVIDG